MSLKSHMLFLGNNYSCLYWFRLNAYNSIANKIKSLNALSLDLNITVLQNYEYFRGVNYMIHSDVSGDFIMFPLKYIILFNSRLIFPVASLSISESAFISPCSNIWLLFPCPCSQTQPVKHQLFWVSHSFKAGFLPHTFALQYWDDSPAFKP